MNRDEIRGHQKSMAIARGWRKNDYAAICGKGDPDGYFHVFTLDGDRRNPDDWTLRRSTKSWDAAYAYAGALNAAKHAERTGQLIS